VQSIQATHILVHPIKAHVSEVKLEDHITDLMNKGLTRDNLNFNHRISEFKEDYCVGKIDVSSNLHNGHATLG
jgi:hypothetical protein